MNQPDLGLKIVELRQQKGMTQEKLAEYCEVSTRTVQRIESGEVEPRPFTRNSLSNTLDETAHGVAGLSVTVKSERTETITVAADTSAMRAKIGRARTVSASRIIARSSRANSS